MASAQVLVALAFYASWSYQTIVGDNRKHCISQASVSKAINQVTKALNRTEVINKYISFPFKLDERESLKREFYSQYKLPGAIGCVDGTHISIVRPKQNEERFYNRKGYHSLNVLVMCDSKLNFLCVDASYPGSTHDSVVWANHPLNAYIERLHSTQGEDVYLLGDSGYPLRPTMMVPLTNPETGTPEANYQSLHLTARSIVERSIGLLKARFRCLLIDRKLHYSPEVAAKLVNACCVLHNIAHGSHMAFTPLTAAEAARERELTEGASRNATHTRRPPRRMFSELQLGHARREALIRRLWADRTIN